MSEPNRKKIQPLRAEELIEKLFSEALADSQKYDPAVVQILKDQLLVKTIPSKAGNKIADNLMEIAQQRAAKSKAKHG